MLLTTVALCQCLGLMSLVPDFLLLGHGTTNSKLFALFHSVSHKEHLWQKQNWGGVMGTLSNIASSCLILHGLQIAFIHLGTFRKVTFKLNYWDIPIMFQGRGAKWSFASFGWWLDRLCGLLTCWQDCVWSSAFSCPQSKIKSSCHSNAKNYKWICTGK